MGVYTLKKLYLAAGCFWGAEKLFKSLPGVVDTSCGYANGSRNPAEDAHYEIVCTGETGFRECVEVVFDPKVTSVDKLLWAYFEVIDPEIANRQGNDIGTQYQAGIYWPEADTDTKQEVLTKVTEVKKQYEHFATEVGPLQNFYLAEEYHQDYLDKNPNGYCHISLSAIARIKETLSEAAVE